MSSLGKPPQHLLDAIKQGKDIDLRDPWVRKMLAEERKQENQKEIIEENKIEDFWIEAGIRLLEVELKKYHKLITDQNNTIEYIDYNCSCKDCDCKTARVILRPDTRHYAEIKCDLCNRHNKWLPYPNSNEECEFK